MNQIKGRLVQVLETKTGMKKDGSGSWYNAKILLETFGQYPKSVVVTIWGNDAMAVNDIELGTTLFVDVSPESKESNGRWYTELIAVKVTKEA